MARLHSFTHIVCFHIAKHGSFDAAVGKVEMRSGVFRLAAVSTYISTITMFHLREGEPYCRGISVGRQTVDDGAAGVAEAEEFGGFVESFSSGVVACVADVFVNPSRSTPFGKVEVGVAAGDNQGEHGKHHRMVAVGAPFYQDSV